MIRLMYTKNTIMKSTEMKPNKRRSTVKTRTILAAALVCALATVRVIAPSAQA
jgi:hypothetical protein